jgi:hypothetical protein
MAAFLSQFLSLLLALAAWFLGNFLYGLLWRFLERKFALQESSMMGWCLRHLPPLVPPLLILVAAAYIFGWVSWVIEPASTRKPINQMKIERFVIGDYKFGEHVPIQIYGRYLGNDAIHVQDRHCVYVVRVPDPDPRALGPVQEQIWQNCILDPNGPISGTTVSQPFIMRVKGPILTKDAVSSLNNGGAALLFMGVLRWSDEKDKFQTEYCAYTKEDREIIHFCQDHNGPVTPNSLSNSVVPATASQALPTTLQALGEFCRNRSAAVVVKGDTKYFAIMGSNFDDVCGCIKFDTTHSKWTVLDHVVCRSALPELFPAP